MPPGANPVKRGVIQMEKICRRSFIKKSLAYGAASMMGGELLSAISTPGWGVADADGPVDLSVVKGSDCFRSTVEAMEPLGGMKAFVTKQSKVGLLINSPFKNRGAFVNPDIVLAVVTMCYEAGAIHGTPTGSVFSRAMSCFHPGSS